jgi:teichuronic acid biosynthesis protein TuaE
MPIQKHKIYQFLFISFIISLAGGSYMLRSQLFGVEMYAFRYLLVVSIPTLFFFGDLKFYSNKFTKAIVYFFIFWILYGSLSLLWCEDLKRGVYEIIYLLIGFMTYIFLFSYAHYFKTDFISFLFENWKYALIPNLLMGLWEIQTGNHLYGNYTESLKLLDGMHDNQFVPVTVFDNPNNFAIFLAISLFMLAYKIIMSSSKVLNSLLFTLTFYLMYQTDSRIGIFYSILVLIGLVFYLLKINTNKSVKLVLKVFLASLFYFNSILLLTPYVRVHNNQIKENQKRIMELKSQYHNTIKAEYGTNSYDSLSVNVRKNLILNGIEYFKDSYGVGIGAGSFEAKILKGEQRYPTFGNPNPHNYFIRILSEYGIVIISLFISLFLFVCFKLFRFFFFHKEYLESSFLVFVIVCFVLMSNANSSFLPLPLNWFLFSLIIILFDALNQKYVEAN